MQDFGGKLAFQDKERDPRLYEEPVNYYCWNEIEFSCFKGKQTGCVAISCERSCGEEEKMSKNYFRKVKETKFTLANYADFVYDRQVVP